MSDIPHDEPKEGTLIYRSAYDRLTTLTHTIQQADQITMRLQVLLNRLIGTSEDESLNKKGPPTSETLNTLLDAGTSTLRASYAESHKLLDKICQVLF